MADVSGAIYLEKNDSTVGVTRLRLEVQKFDETIENRLIKVPYPVVSQANQNSTRPSTRYKDLKRLAHVFTIQGYITAQTSVSGVTAYQSPYYDSKVVVRNNTDTLTATQAKNALIYYVLYPYGDIALWWRGAATFSGVTADPTPSSALANLMYGSIDQRRCSVALEKAMFSDEPGKRADKLYVTSSSSEIIPTNDKIYDMNEKSPEKYFVQINLIRGVNF